MINSMSFYDLDETSKTIKQPTGYSIKMISVKESVNTNLIVVPHNLANQWREFMKNSDLKYLTLNTVADFDVFFDIDLVEKQTISVNGVFTIHTKIRKGRAKTLKK